MSNIQSKKSYRNYSVSEKASWMKLRIKEIGSIGKGKDEDTLFTVDMPIVRVNRAYEKPTIVSCTCKNHSIHGMKEGIMCQYTIAVLDALKQ